MVIGTVDIFLSYAPEDAKLLAELEGHLSRLKRDGVIRTWSSRGVGAGEAWSEAEEAQLARARIVLLMVSMDYLASDYLYDLQAAKALDRSRTGNVLVIPLLVRASDWKTAAFAKLAPLPADGRPVCSWEKRDEAWVAVVDGIREAIARLEPVAGGAPRPTPNNLPPRRVFVGRTVEIEGLDEALRRDGRTSITQASLWGLGGVGKTALALEYAHRALENGTYPGGVWWVVAEGRPLDAMAQLAVPLRKHMPALFADVRPDASAEDRAYAARCALESLAEPSLVVLDNVSERGFANLLPGKQVRVLLTTRERHLALGKRTELDILSSADAKALAIERAGEAPAGEAEAAALGRVVEQHLGGLAVAIEVAARAVEWAGGWVAYERHLVKQTSEALDGPEDRNEHYPQGVFAALDMSIDRCGEPARRLLEGAVVFAPDAVPLEWACAAAGAEQESIATQRALGELEGLGLTKVDREAGVMSIHRLVHKRLRDRAEPEGWREARTKAVEHVATWMEKTVGLARQQLEAVDARRPHIDAALAAAEQVEAASMWSLIADRFATHLWYRAEYPEARSLFERALAIDEKTLGPDHPNVAACLSNLATVLPDLGDAAGARPLLERALGIAEKTLGPDHPNVAACLSNLARVLQNLGDAAGARPLLERALAIDENAFGPEHPNVATGLSNLATMLKALGDAAGARPLLERALALYEKTFGLDHPEVATCLSNLATVLQDLGDPAGARPLIERAIAIADKTFGPDHPKTALYRRHLAGLPPDPPPAPPSPR